MFQFGAFHTVFLCVFGFQAHRAHFVILTEGFHITFDFFHSSWPKCKQHWGFFVAEHFVGQIFLFLKFVILDIFDFWMSFFGRFSDSQQCVGSRSARSRLFCAQRLGCFKYDGFNEFLLKFSVFYSFEVWKSVRWFESCDFFPKMAKISDQNKKR